MPAGDFTVEGQGIAGNRRTIWGSLEADHRLRTFGLSRNALLECSLTCSDDTASGRVELNEDADGETAIGSAAVRSNTRSAVTFRFLATIG
jgi:hypothetical protein